MNFKIIKARDSLFLVVLLSLFLYFLYNENYLYISLLLTLIIGYALTPVFFQNTRLFIQAIILLVPLSIDVVLPGGIKISTPSEFLVIAITGLFFYRWLSGFKIDINILKHPISILLLLDLGWTLFATFTSQVPSVSVKRFVIKSLFIIVFYFLFVNSFRKTKELKSLFWLYGLGAVIPILNAIYTHSLLGFNQRASVYVSQPFYIEHTLYAASIAFIIPFFFLSFFSKGKYKWVSFFLLLLFVIAVILAYSRAAWISVVFALVFYILTKLKISFKLLSLSTIVIMVLLVFNFEPIYGELSRTKQKYGNDVAQHLTSVTNLQNDASNLERINRWVSAVNMFKEKPVSGFGPGAYQFVYDDFQDTEFLTRISSHHGDAGNAHSEYLMYLSETGLIGFLIFTMVVIYSVYLSMSLVYSDISKSEKHLVYAAILGLVTFYIHGLFNSFIDSEKMAILYFGSLAILTRISLNKNIRINTHENMKGFESDLASISMN